MGRRGDARGRDGGVREELAAGVVQWKPKTEVEGVEEYLVVSAVVPDEIERGNAVVIAGDSFAILATLRGPAARAPRAATQPPRRR